MTRIATASVLLRFSAGTVALRITRPAFGSEEPGSEHTINYFAFISLIRQAGYIIGVSLAFNHGLEEANIDYMSGGDWWSALTQPVVQCILNGSTEFVKSQMSSAQVLLGVAPTILALIGPSAEEMSTLLLVGRRPLLYLILTCGSPSVFFTRAFEYTNPADLLSDHRFRLRQQHPTGARRWSVTGLEYLFAFAAMANAADVHSDLGMRTICAVLSDWTYAPLLWGGLGVVVHFAGAVVLFCRIKRCNGCTPTADEAPHRNKHLLWWLPGFRASSFTLSSIKGSLQRLAASEITMCAHHQNLHYSVLSLVTMVHIVFGTMVLSSLIIIGPRDALSVVGRYMSSVIACRVILMYELSGLRDAYKSTHA
ncbi:hypothetical protein B0T19DRAFT_466946 [Cercophora scortea]|uniref:Uncharacterized protein n=1 Tax=Cercophora scortea TaxID=314031 RepID=A0AAE0M770_9PEZI|nr:hypothetical protein B0T19DRAFT_466946 [Cercophora scortea]